MRPNKTNSNIITDTYDYLENSVFYFIDLINKIKNPVLKESAFLFTVTLCILIIYFVFKKLFFNNLINFIDKRTSFSFNSSYKIILHRIASLISILIIYFVFLKLLYYLFPKNTFYINEILEKLIECYIIYSIFRIFIAIVNAIQKNSSLFNHVMLSNLLDIIKASFMVVSIVFIISRLLDIQISVIFTGLGALLAVIIFVFQDTLKGIISMIYVLYYDLFDIGDWIKIPSTSIEGNFLFFKGSSMLIAKFDKTIITVPSKSILENGVINVNAMKLTNTRRIKEVILVEPSSIQDLAISDTRKILSNNVIGSVLKEYEIQDNLTNIALFQDYFLRYLKTHKEIDQSSLTLVRFVGHGLEGYKIEIYTFTNTSVWEDYELIKSYIMSHAIAILKEFNLTTPINKIIDIN